MSAVLSRARRGLRRYGLAGAMHRTVSIAGEALYSRSDHVWYELVLADDRPRRRLDAAFVLLQAGPKHLGLLDDLWAIDQEEARRRLAGGGTLWLVLDGDAPVFSCWTFEGRTPVRAAPGGWLELPADTVCLEESLTAPAYRGRGVAPAAWSEISDRIQDARRMVTTIEEENVASRKAVEKIGFHEIAHMHAVKVGPRYQVTADHGDEATAFLGGLRHV